MAVVAGLLNLDFVVTGLLGLVPTSNILAVLLVDVILTPIFGLIAVVAAWITLSRQMEHDKPGPPPNSLADAD